MRSVHLLQMLKRRSLWLSLLTTVPLIVVIFGLTGCVKHPVGDPEKSKVDPRFVGAWSATDQSAGMLMIMRPYDSRTYLVNLFEFQKSTKRIEPKGRADYKAWLTPIGGETFITMKPLRFAQFTGDEDETWYIVAKLSVVGDSIHLRIVNADAGTVKNARNRRELEAVVTKHSESDSLYLKPIQIFAKNDDKARVKAVIDAFETWGDDKP